MMMYNNNSVNNVGCNNDYEKAILLQYPGKVASCSGGVSIYC